MPNLSSGSLSIKFLLDYRLTINDLVDVKRYISLKDVPSVAPPEHLPPNIEAAFREGAMCLAVECFNAAATMFRLCVDHGTRVLLPKENADGLNSHIRRTLGLRLNWLLDQKLLPKTLRELSAAGKEDGNDGAHEGTLTEADATDLLDFTVILLERMYTEPKKLELAKARRTERRAP